jgi:PAS domain S-box-containing protein
MLKTNLKTIHPTDITEDYFGSYYCCCLENPYQLSYASQSLCDMLGYTAIEIYDHFKRKYSQMVHEEDRQQYLQFIDTLASKEQTLSLEYRMICKDGHIIYINDIMTSHRLDDGQMYGFAVTADITHTHSNLSADSHMDLAQLIDSCGFLQCTCDKYPKVTYINEQMLNYLGLTPPEKF